MNIVSFADLSAYLRKELASRKDTVKLEPEIFGINRERIDSYSLDTDNAVILDGHMYTGTVTIDGVMTPAFLIPNLKNKTIRIDIGNFFARWPDDQ